MEIKQDTYYTNKENCISIKKTASGDFTVIRNLNGYNENSLYIGEIKHFRAFVKQLNEVLEANDK